MDDELVLIARFDMGMEAHEASFVLEDQGIECAIDDETAANLGFPGTMGLGGVKLLVRASDAGRAVALLAETPAGKNLLVGPPDEPDPENNAGDPR